MNQSLKINTLAAAVCLVLASSAYASNDNDSNHVEGSSHVENHSSNHTESANHVENHGSSHVESDHHSVRDGNSASGKIKLKSYLSAGVEPLANGEVKLEQKTSKSEFSAEVKLPVPSAALAVANVTDASDATLNLYLTDSQGLDYAECSLDLKQIKNTKKTKRSAAVAVAEYKVEIKSRNGFLQGQYGVCDIDLNTAGIQSGIPLVQVGDSVEVTIDTNNALVASGSF
ncbi:MAG: hypothetical protein ABL925_04695 [Methylococcales bacterium]